MIRRWELESHSGKHEYRNVGVTWFVYIGMRPARSSKNFFKSLANSTEDVVEWFWLNWLLVRSLNENFQLITFPSDNLQQTASYVSAQSDCKRLEFFWEFLNESEHEKFWKNGLILYFSDGKNSLEMDRKKSAPRGTYTLEVSEDVYAAKNGSDSETWN